MPTAPDSGPAPQPQISLMRGRSSFCFQAAPHHGLEAHTGGNISLGASQGGRLNQQPEADFKVRFAGRQTLISCTALEQADRPHSQDKPHSWGKCCWELGRTILIIPITATHPKLEFPLPPHSPASSHPAPRPRSVLTAASLPLFLNFFILSLGSFTTGILARLGSSQRRASTCFWGAGQ